MAHYFEHLKGRRSDDMPNTKEANATFNRKILETVHHENTKLRKTIEDISDFYVEKALSEIRDKTSSYKDYPRHLEGYQGKVDAEFTGDGHHPIIKIRWAAREGARKYFPGIKTIEDCDD